MNYKPKLLSPMAGLSNTNKTNSHSPHLSNFNSLSATHIMNSGQQNYFSTGSQYVPTIPHYAKHSFIPPEFQLNTIQAKPVTSMGGTPKTHTGVKTPLVNQHAASVARSVAFPANGLIQNNHGHAFNNAPVQPEMNPLLQKTTDNKQGSMSGGQKKAASHHYPHQHSLSQPGVTQPFMSNNAVVQPFGKLFRRIFGGSNNEVHPEAVVHHTVPEYRRLNRPPPPPGRSLRRPPPPPDIRPSLSGLHDMSSVADTLPPLSTHQQLVKAAKSHYSSDLPHGASTLDEPSKIAVLKHLQRLHSNRSVDIYAQGKPDIPMHEFSASHTWGQGMAHFAYRFKHRNAELAKQYSKLHHEGKKSRVTLSVKPEYAGHLMDAMADAYSSKDLPENLITGMKIMGPDNLGNRTDTAVIYLGDHDAKRAQQVASYFHDRLGTDAFYDHHPKGMEPLGTGVSYSEFRRHPTSTSHGAERSDIVAHAIERQGTHSDASLHDVLAYTLHESGYDADRPSRVRRASSRSIIKPWSDD